MRQWEREQKQGSQKRERPGGETGPAWALGSGIPAGMRRFIGLSFTQQSLLAQALSLILLIRLGLRVASARRVQAWLSPVAGNRRTAMNEAAVGAETVRWAVTVASHLVPGTTCLPQALAADTLLRRHGQPSTLRLGVARHQTGRFGGHIWVESGGLIVVGGPGRERYTEFPGAL